MFLEKCNTRAVGEGEHLVRIHVRVGPFWPKTDAFPILPEAALQETLEILARTVAPEAFPEES